VLNNYKKKMQRLFSPVNKIAVAISWDDTFSGVAFIFDTKDSKLDITCWNILDLTFWNINVFCYVSCVWLRLMASANTRWLYLRSLLDASPRFVIRDVPGFIKIPQAFNFLFFLSNFVISFVSKYSLKITINYTLISHDFLSHQY